MRHLLIALSMFLIFGAKEASAACSTPAGVAGQILFQTPDFLFCDGTNWTSVSTSGLIGLSCTDNKVPMKVAGSWSCVDAVTTSTASSVMTRDASGDFAADDASLLGLVLRDGLGGLATVRAPVGFTSYNLTLPANDGNNGEFLQTNGSGVLSWAPADLPAADSLDFTEFKDAMTLDASTDISVTGTNVLSVTNTGTGNSFRVNDQAGDTTPFVIDAAGLVGIGTASPGSILDIRESADKFTNLNLRNVNTGASTSSIFTTETDAGYLAMGTESVASGGRARIYTSASAGLNLESYFTGDIRFFTVNATTERMRIANDGKVGIGTPSPNQLLTVEGPMSLRAQAAPSLTANYGKIYVDSGDSNKLKYMNPAGAVTDLSAAGGGGLPAADGSSAAPSISFTNDSDTGFFLAASGALGVTASGTHVGSFTAAQTEFYGLVDIAELYVGIGSAAAPSLLVGDNNSGIFRPAANVVGISTDGSERMRVDATGNVAIGASSANGKLDVKGSIVMTDSIAGYTGFQPPVSAPNLVYTMPSTAPTAGQFLSSNASGVLSWAAAGSPAADSLDFTEFKDAMALDASTDISVTGTNVLSVTNTGTGKSFVVNDEAGDTTPFVIDAAGKVGIMNTAPSRTLDLTHPAGETEIRLRGGSWSDSGIRLLTGDGTGRTWLIMETDGTDSFMLANKSGKFWINPGSNINALHANSAQFTDSGFLGLGLGTAATPTERLQMKGALRFDGATSGYTGFQAPATSPSLIYTLPVTAPTAGQFLSSNASGVLSWAAAGGSVADDSLDFDKFVDAMTLDASTDIAVTGTNVFSITNTGTGHSLLINDQAGDSSPFVIDAAGNVGVGTTSIAEKVHVFAGSGDAALKIETNGTGAGDNAGLKIDRATVNGSAYVRYDTNGSSQWQVGLYQDGTTNYIVREKINDVNPMTIEQGAATANSLYVKSTGNVGVGTDSPNGKLDVKGSVVMSGATSGYSGFQVPLAANNMIYTLPATAPTAGQFLSSNASGVLSWAAAGSPAADSLDFAEFKDAMALDASTDISVTGTNVLSITNTGTGNSFVVNDEAGDASPFVISNSGNVTTGGSITSANGISSGGSLYVQSYADIRKQDFTDYVANSTVHAGQQMQIVNDIGGDTHVAGFTMQARNAANTYQVAYMGAVANTAGVTPEIVIGTAAGGGNYNERLRIAANGDTRIGVMGSGSYPKLEVAGAAGYGYLQGGADSTLNVFGAYNLSLNSGNLIEMNKLIHSHGNLVMLNGAEITSNNGSDLVLSTNDGTDRLTITNASGNVGIGTSTPNQKLTVEGPMSLRTQAAPTATANYGKIYVDSGDSNKLKYMNPAGAVTDLTAGGGGGSPGGANTQIQFNNSGSFAGSSNFIWDNSGNALTVTGDINYTGVLTDTSDRRLKTNIERLPSALPKLRQMETYSYSMKNDPQEQTEFGLMAQDLQEILPEVVKPIDDTFFGVNYMGLIAWIIKAVQELDGENQKLKEENVDLKNRVKALEQAQEKSQAQIDAILKKLEK